VLRIPLLSSSELPRAICETVVCRLLPLPAGCFSLPSAPSGYAAVV